MHGTIFLAVGIVLIFGAGIPSNPLILPLWFGSMSSQRGGLLPLHPGIARLAGIASIVLWYVMRRGVDAAVIVALATVVFFLLAVAMVMGVTRGIRR